MCVDRVGGAGDQRHPIMARLRSEVRKLIGLDRLDLIDTVRECVVEHVKIELVTLLELVQARK